MTLRTYNGRFRRRRRIRRRRKLRAANRLAQSKAARGQAVEDSASPPPAAPGRITPPQAPIAWPDVPSKAEIRKELKDLGIEHDARLGVKRLQALLRAAKAKDGQGS